MSLKCWRCGGPHLRCIFPHGEWHVWPAYNVQGHGIEAIGKWEQESSLDAAVTIRSLTTELQDCKEENKKLVKAMGEQSELITAMLQNVAYLQIQINSRHQLTKEEASRKNSHKKNEKLNPREKGFKPSRLLK